MIATARSEEQHWSKLDFDKHPLWKRFTCYELPALTDQALISLLESYADQQEVTVDEAGKLVIHSDGMAQTIVSNVNRAVDKSNRLSTENWANSADRNWREVYEEISRHVPAAPRLYDAAYLVREADLPPQVPYYSGCGSRSCWKELAQTNQRKAAATQVS